jgi:hypothetical protein
MGLHPAIREAYEAEIKRLTAEKDKQKDPTKRAEIDAEIADLEAELVLEDWPMFDD